MVDYIPQDEYFEWEDILVYRDDHHVKDLSYGISKYECEDSLSPTPDVVKKIEDGLFCWDDAETRTGEQPNIAAGRSISTSASLSPITTPECAKVASPIDFPTHDHQAEEGSRLQPPPQQCKQVAKDDSEAYFHPSRCVDYFQHQWSLEDMSTCWRHIRTREKSCKNAERLENASWRSWAKMFFDLKTVSPETVNWMKDLDDICLYGPFQATTSDCDVITPCDNITIPILKRPSISELLLQGSQLSWTGSRRRSTGGIRLRKTKRSVKFNLIIEQCITVTEPPHETLPKTKFYDSKSDAAIRVSSVPTVEQVDNNAVEEPSFWTPATSLQPKVNSIASPSENSQWTWLTPSDDDELDWISPQPSYFPSTYTPPPPSPPSTASIVRDFAAKSHYVPKRRFQDLPPREQTSSDEDDEDEMMAQYLFDCDFKSDSGTISPSESSTLDEYHDDDDVDFFDGGDLADETRLMEELHEIPMMERMKQTLYEQVRLGWES